ncbi:MAG: protein jag [Clostridiales bacterium]|nr:protein jag [Clostridiales bacterium]
MQFTAKTVEEAIDLGLKELNTTVDKAVITVLEQPTKGIFGKLKGKAVVEIEIEKSDAERTVEFVQGILDLMDIKAVAALTSEDDNTVITLTGTEATSSSIIGYRGEVLDAIQTIAGAALNIGKKEYKKVVVDCENYREKREDTLIKLAHKLEEKATEMRREVILEPMSPFERRIIHTALAESKTVTTKSDGKEPNRYVVIVPFDKDEFSKPYNAGRNNSDRGGKRDNRKNNHRNNSKGGFKGSRGGKTVKYGETKKKSSSFSFGTYLGNSLKDN